MQVNLEQVKELIAAPIAALGLQLWGCEMIQEDFLWILRVYIDSAEGILIEDCEKVSRHIEPLLDVEDPIPGEYFLEVSSPGVDRPLFEIEHYQAYLGHSIKVWKRLSDGKRRKLVGELQAVREEYINLKIDNEIHELRFDEIQRAKLVSII